jgi:tRNA (cytidine/uridine-2'-O-)-methyltransferase
VWFIHGSGRAKAFLKRSLAGDLRPLCAALNSQLKTLNCFMLHVVLIEPEIPPNTGNIGRLCLGAGAHLHLVKPLGFSIDDRTLKRAGLDYWKDVRVTVWDSFADLQAAQAEGARYFFLTTKTRRVYWDAAFQDGDFLVFGRETKGLPEPLLERNAERCLTIPMAGATRSLNLATAVGIVLYEAVRQGAVGKVVS